MHVFYNHCGERRQVRLGKPQEQSGPLRCQLCNELILTIDVDAARPWLESQVARKRVLSESGELGTRKQSAQQSDNEIDLDGLSAELAACALLCPGSFDAWRTAAESSKGNRGQDLRRLWTSLNKPVEVKFTRHYDEQRGFLLVRPPRNTPGRMRVEYIDDSYYILMVGCPPEYSAVGWTDRSHLLRVGVLNPVPIQPGQRECWGMHWSTLRPMKELFDQAHSSGPLGVIARWFADLVGG
ncbi:MAG: hypothetical protein H6822_11765 [Planctomycetaceae bacterium]|nr:hypothetical protein [Planctomycetales bacterium]MCB9922853.1 hypothetical protein [Planctomycetaceae bacterium]